MIYIKKEKFYLVVRNDNEVKSLHAVFFSSENIMREVTYFNKDSIFCGVHKKYRQDKYSIIKSNRMEKNRNSL